MSVPLAPALGRLAAPPPAIQPFDATRLDLVDRLLLARADGALARSDWLAAWSDATTAVAHRVVEEGREAMRQAAAESRYPARRLAVLLPDQEFERELCNRLQAEGIVLEQLAADAGERRHGAALEAAWEAAVRVAVIERQRLLAAAGEIARWRRPWRPFVMAAIVAVLVVGVIAAMLGGVLASPAWFRPVTGWFWSLPWP